jgi:DNA polymerase III alpha subunit
MRGHIIATRSPSPKRPVRAPPGLLVIVHTPPTKSGKRVMFITMEDETGLLDVVAFPRVLDRYAKIIRTSEVLTVKGRLQRQGTWGKSLSVIMERVILPWSGLLSDLLLKKMG